MMYTTCQKFVGNNAGWSWKIRGHWETSKFHILCFAYGSGEGSQGYLGHLEELAYVKIATAGDGCWLVKGSITQSGILEEKGKQEQQ